MEIEDTSGTDPQGGGEQEPSLRDTLEAAVEEHAPGGESGEEHAPGGESGEGSAAPNEGEAAGGAQEGQEARRQSVTERARDGQGRFARSEPGKEAAPKPGAPGKAPGKPGDVRQPAAGEQGQPAPFRGPQSWNPAAREALGKADPIVQKEVMRREREVSQALQQSAEARRTAHGLQQLMAPYQAFIRAENSNDFQAIDNMMRTAVGLRTLPAPQKAQMMANLCHQFGVDPNLLDQAWSSLVEGRGGRAPELPNPRQAQPQQFRDPRLDPLIERLQQQEQQEYQAVVEERDNFAESHAFYQDVRLDMADIIEMRGKRGLTTTLDQAYDLACMANEQVRPLYEQGKAAERARTGKPGIQRARAAASSIRASPGIRTPQGADPSDLRAVLEESMAEQSSR